MFARSTTFYGNPDKIDEGIAFVTGEVAPTLKQVDGCRGLSLVADRESGMCIATSSWDDEETMRASDDQIRPMRDRAGEMLGGAPQTDEWEVAVMHRNSHAQCCRVSWLRGDIAAMIDSFRLGILPELDQTAGFCSASLLVNRSTGMGCATTAWESRDAMEASRSSADDMRRRAANESSGEIIDVREFELAYAHLHVPEMA